MYIQQEKQKSISFLLSLHVESTRFNFNFNTTSSINLFLEKILSHNINKNVYFSLEITGPTIIEDPETNYAQLYLFYEER